MCPLLGVQALIPSNANDVPKDIQRTQRGLQLASLALLHLYDQVYKAWCPGGHGTSSILCVGGACCGDATGDASYSVLLRQYVSTEGRWRAPLIVTVQGV